MTWLRSQVTQLADNYNEPTKFTAFIGYEWTPSEEEGSSQHRVVLFADDSSYADQILPFSSYDSAHEEDLWQFLEIARGLPRARCRRN